MPSRPKTPCRSGCGVLVEQAGYCGACQSMVRKTQDAVRGSAHERGYTTRWQKASKGFLRSHPLCQCDECDEGRIRYMQATVVDHIVPHRLMQALSSGDPVQIARARELFWDNKNWQSMAKTCHDKKTAREDGGFGRPLQTSAPAH